MSRCVECGYPKDMHDTGLRCPSGGKAFSTMELRDGLCCNDCAFVVHCCAMYGKKPGDTSCDFFPVRFQLHPRFAPAQTGATR